MIDADVLFLRNSVDSYDSDYCESVPSVVDNPAIIGEDPVLKPELSAVVPGVIPPNSPLQPPIVSSQLEEEEEEEEECLGVSPGGHGKPGILGGQEPGDKNMQQETNPEPGAIKSSSGSGTPDSGWETGSMGPGDVELAPTQLEVAGFVPKAPRLENTHPIAPPGIIPKDPLSEQVEIESPFQEPFGIFNESDLSYDTSKGQEPVGEDSWDVDTWALEELGSIYDGESEAQLIKQESIPIRSDTAEVTLEEAPDVEPEKPPVLPIAIAPSLPILADFPTCGGGGLVSYSSDTESEWGVESVDSVDSQWALAILDNSGVMPETPKLESAEPIPLHLTEESEAQLIKQEGVPIPSDTAGVTLEEAPDVEPEKPPVLPIAIAPSLPILADFPTCGGGGLVSNSSDTESEWEVESVDSVDSQRALAILDNSGIMPETLELESAEPIPLPLTSGEFKAELFNHEGVLITDVVPKTPDIEAENPPVVPIPIPDSLPIRPAKLENPLKKEHSRFAKGGRGDGKRDQTASPTGGHISRVTKTEWEKKLKTDVAGENMTGGESVLLPVDTPCITGQVPILEFQTSAITLGLIPLVLPIQPPIVSDPPEEKGPSVTHMLDEQKSDDPKMPQAIQTDFASCGGWGLVPYSDETSNCGLEGESMGSVDVELGPLQLEVAGFVPETPKPEEYGDLAPPVIILKDSTTEQVKSEDPFEGLFDIFNKSDSNYDMSKGQEPANKDSLVTNAWGLGELSSYYGSGEFKGGLVNHEGVLVTDVVPKTPDIEAEKPPVAPIPIPNSLPIQPAKLENPLKEHSPFAKDGRGDGKRDQTASPTGGHISRVTKTEWEKKLKTNVAGENMTGGESALLPVDTPCITGRVPILELQTSAIAPGLIPLVLPIQPLIVSDPLEEKGPSVTHMLGDQKSDDPKMPQAIQTNFASCGGWGLVPYSGSETLKCGLEDESRLADVEMNLLQFEVANFVPETPKPEESRDLAPPVIILEDSTTEQVKSEDPFEGLLDIFNESVPNYDISKGQEPANKDSLVTNAWGLGELSSYYGGESEAQLIKQGSVPTRSDTAKVTLEEAPDVKPEKPPVLPIAIAPPPPPLADFPTCGGGGLVSYSSDTESEWEVESVDSVDSQWALTILDNAGIMPETPKLESAEPMPLPLTSGESKTELVDHEGALITDVVPKTLDEELEKSPVAPIPIPDSLPIGPAKLENPLKKEHSPLAKGGHGDRKRDKTASPAGGHTPRVTKTKKEKKLKTDVKKKAEEASEGGKSVLAAIETLSVIPGDTKLETAIPTNSTTIEPVSEARELQNALPTCSTSVQPVSEGLLLVGITPDSPSGTIQAAGGACEAPGPNIIALPVPEIVISPSAAVETPPADPSVRKKRQHTSNPNQRTRVSRMIPEKLRRSIYFQVRIPSRRTPFNGNQKSRWVGARSKKIRTAVNLLRWKEKKIELLFRSMMSDKIDASAESDDTIMSDDGDVVICQQIFDVSNSEEVEMMDFAEDRPDGEKDDDDDEFPERDPDAMDGVRYADGRPYSIEAIERALSNPPPYFRAFETPAAEAAEAAAALTRERGSDIAAIERALLSPGRAVDPRLAVSQQAQQVPQTTAALPQEQPRETVAAVLPQEQSRETVATVLPQERPEISQVQIPPQNNAPVVPAVLSREYHQSARVESALEQALTMPAAELAPQNNFTMAATVSTDESMFTEAEIEAAEFLSNLASEIDALVSDNHYNPQAVESTQLMLEQNMEPMPVQVAPVVTEQNSQQMPVEVAPMAPEQTITNPAVNTEPTPAAQPESLEAIKAGLEKSKQWLKKYDEDRERHKREKHIRAIVKRKRTSWRLKRTHFYSTLFDLESKNCARKSTAPKKAFPKQRQESSFTVRRIVNVHREYKKTIQKQRKKKVKGDVHPIVPASAGSNSINVPGAPDCDQMTDTQQLVCSAPDAEVMAERMNNITSLENSMGKDELLAIQSSGAFPGLESSDDECSDDELFLELFGDKYGNEVKMKEEAEMPDVEAYDPATPRINGLYSYAPEAPAMSFPSAEMDTVWDMPSSQPVAPTPPLPSTEVTMQEDPEAGPSEPRKSTVPSASAVPLKSCLKYPVASKARAAAIEQAAQRFQQGLWTFDQTPVVEDENEEEVPKWLIGPGGDVAGGSLSSMVIPTDGTTAVRADDDFTDIFGELPESKIPFSCADHSLCYVPPKVPPVPFLEAPVAPRPSKIPKADMRDDEEYDPFRDFTAQRAPPPPQAPVLTPPPSSRPGKAREMDFGPAVGSGEVEGEAAWSRSMPDHFKTPPTAPKTYPGTLVPNPDLYPDPRGLGLGAAGPSKRGKEMEWTDEDTQQLEALLDAMESPTDKEARRAAKIAKTEKKREWAKRVDAFWEKEDREEKENAARLKLLKEGAPRVFKPLKSRNR
ncbi:hypothetical protein L873DRAFT_1507752 [Choiromyces venosus 120613-1]|uniref:Uncharacterized protein n=1 Tax=Choiromyces venosus 120613-1 TaxID=1336337 RepID=A0A3N4JAP5_9PEZI|nr:hypothetical protein L873DRAFT_1507752 [Choiromyces venosus 120613-1]